ncbi:tigger transposable element-derived protein 7-like [Macrobrachium rosenbergii]|uniref:tigger transposable element-derived protein 7-like n=1 Tax=Macrobrachium rosenbergii TaxID=79674 RepID=UPI0034D4096B
MESTALSGQPYIKLKKYEKEFGKKLARSTAHKEVIHHQTQDLGIAKHRVKALLLVDNAPAHSNTAQLVGDKGHISVMYLPPNTTAFIQPVDEGVTVATKRLYRRKFLEEVMVVLEDEEKREGLDTQGQWTLEDLPKYLVKPAIYNFAGAWKGITLEALSHSWNCILNGEETIMDFQGFNIEDFCATLATGGDDVPEDDVQDWLDDDGGNPGYQFLFDSEMVVIVTGEEVADDNDEDKDEDDV